MKKTVSVFLAIILSLCIGIPALADTPTPYLNYINGGTYAMPIDGNIAKPDMTISARNCTSVKLITTIMQKVNGEWTDYKAFSVEEPGRTAVIYNEWYVPSGYSYKCRFEWIAKINDKEVEHVTEYNEAKYVY